MMQSVMKPCRFSDVDVSVVDSNMKSPDTIHIADLGDSERKDHTVTTWVIMTIKVSNMRET
jgi:hypothetical protein